MKTLSPTLSAIILGGDFVDFDCYTFTLANGSTLRYTNADFPISDGTNTWLVGVPIDDAQARPQAHWKVGLDVDTWTTIIMPRSADTFTGTAYPDTIDAVSWLTAAAAGALDGAKALVQRAYFATPPLLPISESGVVPIGFITIFFGLVGDAEVVGSRATITLNDMRHLLSVNMPRLVYQAPCSHILFDTRCGLAASTYAVSGTADVGSTPAVIQSAISAPGGSGTYTLGRVRFSAGKNAGLSRTIRAWDGASKLFLFTPFPHTVAPGDAFAAYPGCNKQLETCGTFGNRVNFGGTPFVPIPETTI